MTEEAGFSSFIKELAQKQIVGRELSPEAQEQLWDALTVEEKQRYRSLEMTKTVTGDKALLDSIIDQAKKTQGFKTLELFPKKGYESYIMIMDGHRLYCNTRRHDTMTYRCKYHPSGCFAKAKISEGSLRTVNTHQNHPVSYENYHYRCPYNASACTKVVFTDLRERKKHILETRHPGGMHANPWPMDPARCIFAEFDDIIKEGKRSVPDKIMSLNHQPNLADQIKRLQIIEKNLVIKTSEAEAQQYAARAAKAGEEDNDKEGRLSSKRRKKENKEKENKTSSKELRQLQDTTPNFCCEICDITFTTAKRKADHEFSNRHKENMKVKTEQEVSSRASLTYDKPIFTEEFLQYNKALESELRSLRKGAVELEEQNAVLGTHIDSLRGVVEELRQGRDQIEAEKQRLQVHLEDLQAELSRVFRTVSLPKNKTINEHNFDMWWNELVLIMKGKGNAGMKEIIKRGLKSIEVTCHDAKSGQSSIKASLAYQKVYFPN